MKKIYLLLASCLILLFLNRCTRNQSFISPTDEMLTHSNWDIDYFFDSQNITSDYGGYHFLFSSTGAVAVQKQDETAQGTWNISVDSNNNEILTIYIVGANDNISKFNQQWKLTGKTTSTLQFEEAFHTGITSLLRIKRQ